MIQIHISNKEISFRVMDELFRRIKDWTYAIDEEVFNHQLTTGRFANREFDPEILALMKRVKAEGGILPYYGAGGSRGVCTYHFHLMLTESKLTVVHGPTRKMIEFATPQTIVAKPIESERGLRFKFSPFPHLVKEKTPEAWSGEAPKTLACRIIGKELENLIHWEHWVDNLALSGRYIYSFREVSLGSTGFGVEVQDRETNNMINITDYHNW